MTRLSLTSLLLLTLLVPSARGEGVENWPQWRGPRFDNVSRETGVPVTWSQTENVVWRTPMPGPAGATPVFWGDRIFLTSVRGEDLLLLAMDTSGKVLWEQVMATGNKDVRGDEGNSAANSPSTDGKHVWAMMATGVIGCYDFNGREVWKFNLQERYGKFDIAFGMTATPILDGDRLYVQLIHGEGNPQTREAIVVCLDKATGNERSGKSIVPAMPAASASTPTPRPRSIVTPSASS